MLLGLWGSFSHCAPHFSWLVWCKMASIDKRNLNLSCTYELPFFGSLASTINVFLSPHPSPLVSNEISCLVWYLWKPSDRVLSQHFQEWLFFHCENTMRRAAELITFFILQNRAVERNIMTTFITKKLSRQEMICLHLQTHTEWPNSKQRANADICHQNTFYYYLPWRTWSSFNYV